MRASEALRAPAKLNLTLEVLGRRSDGLHGLRSVMVPINLADEIHITSHEDGFSFSCDVPDLRNDNLVTQAFDVLPLLSRKYRVTLEKHIPTGAGMGGGSSDAAAILLAAGRGIFGEPPEVDYLRIARSLGSDVPFFLVETAAIVEGTGERVTALGPVPPWHVVVVKPPVAVSTPWAYEQIDSMQRPSRPRTDSVTLQMAEALQRAQFDRALSLLQNDFDEVLANTPEIREAIDMLRDAGAPRALPTGSGSCVFTICEGAGSAAAIAASLPRKEGFVVYTAAFWNGEAWRNAA
jgi:4-diphosphocytidyl-2-C-methyl-D-erythritol kinase